ncbi:DUF6722 family protein [uncultured Parabacteroides sp.]|uniref:DUF6722 family protein n=1 Tax=uncultured Parabacteroides sp. TaxID=512312 RepID=UPI0026358E78|nr:DUF6722 family protein [uncultured Parabacteroides sp.]
MKRKQNVNFHLLPIVKEESVSIPKEVARYLLDISKLIIGGAVITATLDIIPDKMVVIYVAGATATLVAICAFITLIINKKDRQ